jgi:peptidyl-prolyl cis-trans isomerase A (cyclophilin A)
MPERIVMRVFIVLSLALASVSQSPARARLLTPDAPEFSVHAPDRCVVVLDTSKGSIAIEVTRAWAPLGADRFVALVRHGYYDDNRFFRVAPGWAQFGINGDPAVAQAWRVKTIPDDPFKESNVRGTVAFAFAVANGRTTQVFFNQRDNSSTHDAGRPADGQPFVPFGRILEGLDVAAALDSEYGEGPGGIRAGRQDPFFDGGNAWLLKQFPRLDYIRTALIR